MDINEYITRFNAEKTAPGCRHDKPEKYFK
jgi:hypothetical protein